MKPISPIERMIDAATGYKAEQNLPKTRAVTGLDVEAQALLDVADAAKAWYLAGEKGYVTALDVAVLKEAVAVWIRRGG